MAPLNINKARFSTQQILAPYWHAVILVGFILIASGKTSLLTALFSYLFTFDFSFTPIPRATFQQGIVVSESSLRMQAIFTGGFNLMLGALLWASHRWGFRKLQTKQNGTWHKIFCGLGAAIFGLITILASVAAINKIVAWAFPVYNSGDPPGGAIAGAICFGVLWGYYILGLIRIMRANPSS